MAYVGGNRCVDPDLEGGALRAQIKIATAQQAQAVAHYGAVALAAFREVENALANEQFLVKRIRFLQRALVDRTAAVQIATVQYQAGRRDLLWVAQLHTAQLITEASVIQLHDAQGANRIRLHLALGGSFDAKPAASPAPAPAPRPQTKAGT